MITSCCLECMVTLTTNNSNHFLGPICAVHSEVRRQFVASVFGMTLVEGVDGNLEQQQIVVTSLEYIGPSHNSTLVT